MFHHHENPHTPILAQLWSFLFVDEHLTAPAALMDHLDKTVLVGLALNTNN